MGFAAAVPFTLVALSAMAVLLADLWLLPSQKRALPWAALAGVLLSAASVAFLWNEEATGFGGAIRLDRFSAFFAMVFLLGTGLVVLLSSAYARREGVERGEYYALLLFGTSGAMLMASAVELVTFFLGLEILSVSLYVLSGFFRQRPASAEAAAKYFILGAFASAFLLYGIALFYGASGSTTYAALRESFGSAAFPYSHGLLALAASGLLLIGLAFKLGAVPFHMWVPDTYEGAPTTITAYMSVVSKAAAAAAFIRVFGASLSSLQQDTSAVLWVLAVVTMTLGNVVAIAQTNIKRMLAYSSIAHAGYLLVALTAAGEAGYSSVLFYVLAYVFMTLGAFGVVSLVRKGEGGADAGAEALDISHYSGLAGRHGLLAAAMAVFMVSLSGIPPTAGFFAKFYVFSAAVRAGEVGLAIIGVLNSLVSVYFYMRIVFLMYMKEETVPVRGSRSRAGWVALAACVLGTLLLGVLPSSFARLATESIASIF
ncbi:MAG: NADH-quinone oxidoreductase subunit N [Candidatus Eisenbacteria bacterium]|nr:NADH-quinone oxidoreductase subunit N [Candidatus Eisenbacteria bacterium]